MNKIWSQEEIAFLIENYPKYGIAYCAEKLGRTTSSISGKAFPLKLNAPGKQSKLKTHEQYEQELLEMEAPCFPVEKYSNARTSIIHECVEGHQWPATPNKILAGRGCPICADNTFNPNKPGLLYYIKIEHENLCYYKVGITNNDVMERFKRDREKSITVLKTELFADGFKAREAERKLLNQYDRVSIEGFLKSGGNTELFEVDILGLDK